MRAREEFAKNISSALQKHVSKASAKREVQVNTSYEVRTQAGEETSVEREIANINVGATLNFVFRQMNQEFIIDSTPRRCPHRVFKSRNTSTESEEVHLPRGHAPGTRQSARAKSSSRPKAPRSATYSSSARRRLRL